MTTGKTPFDYVILSDFHLSEGKNQTSLHVSRFEGFFSDRAFERLLDHLLQRAEDRARRWIAVFNGDLIDFLRVTSIPDPAHPPKGLPEGMLMVIK